MADPKPTGGESSVVTKSPAPWKRFLLGFFAPALLLVAAVLFFTPDFLEWTYPSVLALAVLGGLIAGLRHSRWAFLFGVLTSFAVLALVVIAAEYLKR